MAPSGGQLDEQYYEVAAPQSFGERLVIVARDRIYDDMIRHCLPGRNDTILDVGVSDVVNDAANMLERKYPHLDRVTAAGQIPLLHFWKPSFELACKRLGKADWADERNLILMSRRRLAALTPEGMVPAMGHTGIMLGPFSSNLFLFIDGGEPAVATASGRTRSRGPIVHRRAIKSLRRKGSLLYEPRRRTTRRSLNLGAGQGRRLRAQLACREREGTSWARSSASTSAPPIPASQ